MISPGNLIWIDLEMTGLNPAHDEILELAALATTSDLRLLSEGPSLLIKPNKAVLNTMQEYVRTMHQTSGLLERLASAKMSIADAEKELLTWVKTVAPGGVSPLCGNTIFSDRSFIKRYMPRFDAYLHYRSIDVSSVKELVNRWYSNDTRLPFKKKKTHRALDDIRESVEELRFYRKEFFK